MPGLCFPVTRVSSRKIEFNKLHACLPLAGTGSLCGTPNSISVFCWYKLPICAVHLNVRPLFCVCVAPAKCELCRCNRRLACDFTKPSVVWMYWISVEYICNDTIIAIEGMIKINKNDIWKYRQRRNGKDEQQEDENTYNDKITEECYNKNDYW